MFWTLKKLGLLVNCGLVLTLTTLQSTLTAATIGANPSSIKPTTAAADEYAPNELLVRFTPAADAQLNTQPMTGLLQVNAISAQLTAVNLQVGLTALAPTFPVVHSHPQLLAAALPKTPGLLNTAATLDISQFARTYTLHLTGDVLAAQAAYIALPDVEAAQPNYSYTVQQTLPNDEFYTSGQLWGLSEIEAEQAWAQSSGDGVVVAVIDTGIDFSHPDLAANIYINPAEIANNHLDDDGNGYVDDVQGWDFVEGDNHPQDANGHGSHVAGTIAAVGQNKYGVIGIAPHSKIMPLRGLNRSGSSSDLANALLYASTSAAQVINNSWGGGTSDSLIVSAVKFATLANKVVVSAAGNDMRSTCQNGGPFQAESGLTVSAADKNESPTYFSNYGIQVDLIAPGVDILSTYPNLPLFGTPLIGGDQAKYLDLSGTSMAAPHVSAVAALVRAVRPEWTAAQVKQALRYSARAWGANGFDVQSGYGMVNARQAVALAIAGQPRPLAELNSPANCSEVSGNIYIYGNAGSGQFYEVAIGSGLTPAVFLPFFSATSASNNSQLLATFDTKRVPDGVYTLRVRVKAQDDTWSEDRNEIRITNNQTLCANLADNFEPDNDFSKLRSVTLPLFEQHTHHCTGNYEQDALTFMAIPGHTYLVRVENATGISQLGTLELYCFGDYNGLSSNVYWDDTVGSDGTTSFVWQANALAASWHCNVGMSVSWAHYELGTYQLRITKTDGGTIPLATPQPTATPTALPTPTTCDSADAFENDNIQPLATVLTLNTTQMHNFSCNNADVDWVKLDVSAGESYWLSANPRQSADPVLQLQNASGNVQQTVYGQLAGNARILRWVAANTETLYLQVQNWFGILNSQNSYTLTLIRESDLVWRFYLPLISR